MIILEMSSTNFNNQVYEGERGRVLLELSKSYKNDQRFKLNNDFKDDIDLDRLPQKFRQIAEQGILEKAIKKRKKPRKKPLLIQRYEPGTAKAAQIIKKAEGKKQFELGLIKHMQKIEKKKRISIAKGINKVAKAENMLDGEQAVKPAYQITVKGNRKSAFKSSQFRLFE